MHRITSSHYAEAIGRAFDLLPPAIEARLRHIHFFTGTDPIYAGLHDVMDARDGRSLRNTAHVCYPWNAIDKQGKTTVVLPLLDDACPYIITHELGHCLDEILGFTHTALPINKYAKTNRMEAFAETFAAQYFWLGARAENIFQSDKATQALFEQLSGN